MRWIQVGAVLPDLRGRISGIGVVLRSLNADVPIFVFSAPVLSTFPADRRLPRPPLTGPGSH